jgi:hypothetical protein
MFAAIDAMAHLSFRTEKATTSRALNVIPVLHLRPPTEVHPPRLPHAVFTHRAHSGVLRLLGHHHLQPLATAGLQRKSKLTILQQLSHNSVLRLLGHHHLQPLATAGLQRKSKLTILQQLSHNSVLRLLGHHHLQPLATAGLQRKSKLTILQQLSHKVFLLLQRLSHHPRPVGA